VAKVVLVQELAGVALFAERAQPVFADEAGRCVCQLEIRMEADVGWLEGGLKDWPKSISAGHTPGRRSEQEP